MGHLPFLWKSRLQVQLVMLWFGFCHLLKKKKKKKKKKRGKNIIESIRTVTLPNVRSTCNNAPPEAME